MAVKSNSQINFRHVACAIAFSPRLDGIICEAWKIASRFNAALTLVHIGEHTADKEAQLAAVLNRLNVPATEVNFMWETGDPVKTVISLTKEQKIDLLVFGVLRKENFFKYFAGSVGRNITRKANCSLLLITDPHCNDRQYRNIIVNVKEHSRTPATINTALSFARAHNVNELWLVSEYHKKPVIHNTLDLSEEETLKLQKELKLQEKKYIKKLISRIDTGDVAIHVETATGKPGFAIKKYAAEKDVDLLVLNAPENRLTILDRIFTNDIEYILEDIPCNLLIVNPGK